MYLKDLLTFFCKQSDSVFYFRLIKVDFKLQSAIYSDRLDIKFFKNIEIIFIYRYLESDHF